MSWTRLGDIVKSCGSAISNQRGRYSIRVNRQYRITFRFHANEVHCEDYH